MARTIANVCLGRFRLQIAECRLLTSGEAGLRETPLNPVSQERLQAKKQDLFLLRRRLHKSEGGWNPARNLPGLGAFNPAPPAPRGQGQLQPLEKQRHLVATTAPAALADGAGRHNFFFFFFSAAISLLHTIVQWKHGGRCFMEGALPRPILDEIQGIYLKNIYHTFNVMISLGLYVHLLGLT